MDTMYSATSSLQRIRRIIKKWLRIARYIFGKNRVDSSNEANSREARLVNLAGMGTLKLDELVEYAFGRNRESTESSWVRVFT